MMREVDPGIKVGRHACMIGKLTTTVIGQCVHPIIVRIKALCYGMANDLNRLAGAAWMAVYSDSRSTSVARVFRWSLPITVSPCQISLPDRGCAFSQRCSRDRK